METPTAKKSTFFAVVVVFVGNWWFAHFLFKLWFQLSAQSQSCKSVSRHLTQHSGEQWEKKNIRQQVHQISLQDLQYTSLPDPVQQQKDYLITNWHQHLHDGGLVFLYSREEGSQKGQLENSYLQNKY